MTFKILIIDDSPVVLAMLSDGLIKNGYKVITAKDGLDGLAQARNERPDLIILDHYMPVMEGDEFIVKLKEICGDVMPPVILLTADDLDNELSSSAGISCWLPKTVPIKQLIEKVELCLKKKE